VPLFAAQAVNGEIDPPILHFDHSDAGNAPTHSAGMMKRTPGFAPAASRTLGRIKNEHDSSADFNQLNEDSI